MTKNIFVSVVLLLFISLCPHPGWAGSNDNVSPSIEDVIANHHFIWIGEIFTDGNAKVLCVDTDKHEYALWSPISDRLSVTASAKQMMSVPISEKCAHPNLHGLGTNEELNHMIVNRLPIGGIKPNDSSHSNFSNGATLSLVFDDPSSHCTSSLVSYFTLTYRDGTADSFYIVVRLSEPRQYVVKKGCDDSGDETQTLSEEFDSIAQLASVDLGNGKTLLYSYDTRIHRPVALIIRALPKSVWSSDRNVFIIPTSVLRPSLIKDGRQIKDLSVRYNALLKAIKEFTKKTN
jgi:hypothetical protein